MNISAMELMACGLSFVQVARLVNAALWDYGYITAEDTSQSIKYGKLQCDN